MYALVTLWQLPDQGFEEELRPQLEQRIVPFVQQSAGFVDGYWTYERANGKSVGFTILDTAEHALDLKEAIECQIEQEAAPGVQLEMVRVQEIVARAGAGADQHSRTRSTTSGERL